MRLESRLRGYTSAIRAEHGMRRAARVIDTLSLLANIAATGASRRYEDRLAATSQILLLESSVSSTCARTAERSNASGAHLHGKTNVLKKRPRLQPGSEEEIQCDAKH